METCFIYAILSWIFAGFYSFLNKISAEKNHNGSLVTFYAMTTVFIISFIAFLFTIKIIHFSLLLLWLGVIWWATYFIWSIARIKSLWHIDSSIFFPLYKTFGPLIAVFISFFFFSETLDSNEWIWVILGIFVPIILLWTKNSKKGGNVKLGIILIFITALVTAITWSMWKIVMTEELNLFLYLMILNATGVFASLINVKQKKTTSYSTVHIKRIWIFSWIILFWSWYCWLQALEWNFAIVFTINSLSFLIPILLSVIFYKEHFDIKKWLAILLTIISVYLMK